jgi:HEAT repeat protein
MSATKNTTAEVARVQAAIGTNIQELVKLLGDPEETVWQEASRALMAIEEQIVNPLAGVIKRPTSSVQRIRAIFAVRFLRPRNSLTAQQALIEVENSEKDERIAKLASTVLFGLTLDEIDRKAVEERERKLSMAIANPATTEAFTDQEMKQVNHRLAELRTLE